MSTIDQQKKIYFTLILMALFMLLAPILSFSFWAIFFIFLFGLILATTLINPIIAIFAVLIVRPLLDIFSNLNLFDQLPIHLNPASTLSLILPIIGLIALNQKKTVFQFPLKIFWLFFITTLFLGLPFSVDFTSSLLEIYRIMTFLFFFLIGANLFHHLKNQKRLIKVIILSSLIPALLASWQFLNKTGFSLGFDDINNRLISTFGHPNSFAYFLVLTIILTLSQLTKQKSLATLSLLILQLFTIFGTYTRGAWLALFLVVLIWSFSQFKKLFLFIFLGIIFIYLTFSPIKNRINDFFVPGHGNSASWRINLWQDSFDYLIQKPFFGFGIGNAENIILEKRGGQFGSTEPHNDYLRIALEIGFFGLISYLALKIAIIKKLTQNKTFWTSLTLSIFLALSIAEGFDNILRITALNWPLWLIIGMALNNSKN